MKLYALVSDQGTACYETCLCERHFDDKHKLIASKNALNAKDVPDVEDFHDCSENDALRCIVCNRSNKRYFKTVIEVVVLSESPYDQTDLEQVAYDIGEGDCSGQVNVKSSDEVEPQEMARLLVEQGSDPEFFQLDEEGNELDD